MLRTVVVIILLLLGSSCVQTSSRTWELPVGAKAIQINGYDMSYVERGTGQPVVFVHGGISDYRFFESVMEPLSKQHRPIAVSLRHYYPERWDGTGGNFNMRQHVADVAAFIRALKLAPVHLVGHSRGGSLVLYVATAHPELIRTLTVAEGGTNIPAFEGVDPKAGGAALPAKQRNAKIIELFKEGNTDQGLALFTDNVLGPGAWKALPESMRQMFRDNALTLKGVPMDSYDPYTCADARRIVAPVLLIRGEKSPARFGRILDNLQQCLTNVERVTINDASHDMPVRNAKSFNDAVITFISKY